MRSKHFLLGLVFIASLSAASVFAQTYAITGAKVVTVSGGTIEKGTIVVRNGLIDSVTANGAAPADAAVIDGNGLTVYPGFIDALSTIGMPAAPARAGRQGSAGANQQEEQSNSNYPDGLRPDDRSVEDLKASDASYETYRNAGITTVVVTGKSGIFNGQSVVINLTGSTVSAMVVKEPFAQHVTFTTVGGGQYPGSLLGTFAALRQMLYDAQRQQIIEKQYAANPKGIKRPEADRSVEALIPVINREMPIVFNADSEREIIRAIDLIKEFNLKGIVAGGQEAAKVADRLKAQNIPVLLSLDFPKRTAAASTEADPETLETLRLRAEVPKAAGKLTAAGVKIGFQSGGMKSIGDFLTNAGKAVENGLSKDAAITAMTLGSAEILGIADRSGSIEAGKIANLTIVKGDLFDKDRTVKNVFVDGTMYEIKEAAKPKPGSTRAGPPTANISGVYPVNIEIPGQPASATLNFSQSGSLLTGTMVSQFGTTQITDGKVTADGFSFNGSVEFGGSMIDITVSGTVNGSQISGSISSPQGTIPFSGTKNP